MRPIDADAFKKYIDAQEGRPFIGCTVGEAMKILIDEQPTVQPEKAQLFSEDTTSDLISRTETVEHLRRMLESTVPNTDYDEGFIDGVEFGISTVSTMPSIQSQSTTGQLNDGARSTAQSTDLISRQALCEYALNQKDKSVTPNDIMRFPSAQPESEHTMEEFMYGQDLGSPEDGSL